MRLMRLVRPLLGVFVLAGLALGAEQLVARRAALVPALLRSVERATDPGPLARAHRDPSTGAAIACLKCHVLEAERGIDSARCLVCHKVVADRQATHAGYHGKFSDRCTDCHGEHKGPAADLLALDGPAFNHEQALYRLQGRHRDLACEKCHARPAGGVAADRPRFVGLEFRACSACHADPHQGTLAGSCERCHRETAWTGAEHVRFDHEKDARFALAGKHRAVACERCHRASAPAPAQAAAAAAAPGPGGGAVPPARTFRGIAYAACSDCHADVHAGTAHGACEKCHQVGGWTGAGQVHFDHDQDARYPLLGKHRELECGRCHRVVAAAAVVTVPAAGAPQRTFAAQPFATCTPCHVDPHGGTMHGACARCHGESGWTGAAHVRLDHDRDSRYPLRGRHRGVACDRCHAVAAAPAAPAAAAGGPPTRTRRYVGTPFDRCDACHRDPHQGAVRGACTQCHDERSWRVGSGGREVRGAHFDHERDSTFPLGRLHAATTCRACHATPRYRGTPTDCAACHRPVQQALAGERVVTRGPAAPDVHVRLVSCERCHRREDDPRDAVPYRRGCVACHNAEYGKLYDHRSAALTALRQELPVGEDARAAGLRPFGNHNFTLAREEWETLLRGEH